MLTPVRKNPDERGQRWLQAQVVWVGAVCCTAQRHHVDSSNAEEDGHPVRLARAQVPR